MKKIFKEGWIQVAFAASVFVMLLLINVGLTVRNNNVIRETHEMIQNSESIMDLADNILNSTVHGVDLGVRGFGLTKNEKMLSLYEKSINANSGIFHELEIGLKEQAYPKLNDLKKLQADVKAYIQYSNDLLNMAKVDSMATFKQLLNVDKGFEKETSYNAFYGPLSKYESDLQQEAYERAAFAERYNLILQIFLVVITLPILTFIVLRLRREQRQREKLLQKIHENDVKYVFNSGKDHGLIEEEIIETSIQNSRKASEFIKVLASGDYTVEWKGLNETNFKLNQETLAGDLLNMREKLKTVKAEDEKRNWMNEGLAKFSEIVRNHQHDSKILADKCVSFLTKYLKAQQGSLFVLEGEEGAEYLNLASSYAFDKKKWIEKKIEIGNGLIGQAFLEGEITQLKDVPNGYTHITSGLGDATPRYLVIVPLKYDVHTVAIIELASFIDFEEHHTMFLKKAGEFLASAILNSQTTQKMKALLENAKLNEEQMRAQEEEMRQNMEELQATQEELVRKEKERMKRMEMTS
ncbi:GAF domain-containing protein [Chryseolinea sp. H1M3-3]|uniref:GAF domain-containing protein n=1 Tax=Chryseolinea sp. H1M3-3 TaxID=3034144 RepID=UPI0023EBA733|nr:GAF domain-containing protein [Chryseolinea sp. H1M3-3]